MRLFVAIELDPPVRDALASAQRRLRDRFADVRWVRPEDLHLTIRFFGETSDADAALLTDALRSGASGCDVFDLAIRGGGCFPSSGRVRIIWAGIPDSDHALRDRVVRLEQGFEAAGFAPESRAFSPHITLGRVKADNTRDRLRRAIGEFEFPSVAQHVDTFSMMSSVLSPQGPRYSAIGRFRLGNVDAA